MRLKTRVMRKTSAKLLRYAVPRPRNPVPTYRLHRQSGQAAVSVPLPGGGRKDVLLGRFNSPDSRAEYRRVCSTLDRNGGVWSGADDSPTVNEIMVAFLRFANAYYRRPDARATNEADKYRTVIGVVRKLHGHSPANEFGPLALKEVRQSMIGRGWCRRLVNQQIGRVKRMFKWAVEEELVSPTVYHGLAAVAGLKFGRTDARETEPVKPVPGDVVEATLPQLPRHVAGLVRFQLATGCRPGEACRVRRCDLDTSAEVWFFNPPTHKTTYRGRTRSIAIGPQGQTLLAEFPTGDPSDFVFSPTRQVEGISIAASCAAKRKTPRWPSHQERNRAKRVKAAKKKPGANYTTERYARAVASGVMRGNARRELLAGEGNYDVIPHWHPNQLRHSFATRVRRKHGLEAAQVLLGHANANVTQVYAERDMRLAAEVAREVG